MTKRTNRAVCFIVAAVWLLAACGSRQGKGGSNGSGEGDNAPPALEQVIAVDWALEEITMLSGAVKTKVSLSLTDETGATDVEYMSEFAGRCSEPASGPGAVGEDLLHLSCRDETSGTELRVRRYGTSLVLLRAPTGGPGELSFEEAGRVAVPPGATVRAKQ